MALQLNTFAKRRSILGAMATKLASNVVCKIYPASVAIPAGPPSAGPAGFLVSFTIPSNALVLSGGQIKLNQIINFTPTVTGTAAWVHLDSAASGYLVTDSVVLNGSIGMFVLSQMNLINGTQATLLDFTLNIS